MKLAKTTSILSTIEVLDSRRLFSFVASAYFPLSTRDVSTFTNDNFTRTQTEQAGTIGKVAVVNVLTDYNVTTKSSYLADSYAYDKVGALHRYQTATRGTLDGTLTNTAPTTILPARFNTGVVSKWTKLAAKGIYDVDGDGTPDAVVGADSGTTTVTSGGRVNTGGFAFLDTIHVVVAETAVLSTTFGGRTYRVEISVTDDWYLAKSVGIVNGSEGTSGNGDIYGSVFGHASSSTSLELATSSRAPAFTRKSGSTFRIGGTAGDDVIGFGYDGDASKFLAVRNGIGVSVASAGITKLVIDAGAGSDIVGPLKAGRMRSTILGGDGNDYLIGGSGHDYLDGGAGNDTLVGAPGADTLFGDAGDDILNGSSGNDVVDGGGGTDTAKTDVLDTDSLIERFV